jgi:hypothetical protein
MRGQAKFKVLASRSKPMCRRRSELGLVTFCQNKHDLIIILIEHTLFRECESDNYRERCQKFYLTKAIPIKSNTAQLTGTHFNGLNPEVYLSGTSGDHGLYSVKYYFPSSPGDKCGYDLDHCWTGSRLQRFNRFLGKQICSGRAVRGI